VHCAAAVCTYRLQCALTGCSKCWFAVNVGLSAAAQPHATETHGFVTKAHEYYLFRQIINKGLAVVWNWVQERISVEV